jgi:uroporphyrinogen-III synthase
MAPRILLTRPRDDAAADAVTLEQKGYRTTIEPLLVIEPVAATLDLAAAQAVLATSANGVRAFAAAVATRDVPLFAVGDATARAAHDAGFTSVESAAGDSRDLARLIAATLDPKAGPLVHVAGEDVAGDLAETLSGRGFAVLRRVLYRARARAALTPDVARAIKDGAIDAVLFFSPRSARTFVSLMTAARLAPARAGMAAICLSRAVADAATSAEDGAELAVAWRAVCVAARPDRAALFDALDAWKVQQFTGSS